MRVFASIVVSAVLAAGIAFAEDQGPPKVGGPAPAVELPAVNVGSALPDRKDDKTLRLGDLKGKNVVLFFFPKAMTKG